MGGGGGGGERERRISQCGKEDNVYLTTPLDHMISKNIKMWKFVLVNDITKAHLFTHHRLMFGERDVAPC